MQYSKILKVKYLNDMWFVYNEIKIISYIYIHNQQSESFT